MKIDCLMGTYGWQKVARSDWEHNWSRLKAAFAAGFWIDNTSLRAVERTTTFRSSLNALLPANGRSD
jgi:hypothetical protein